MHIIRLLRMSEPEALKEILVVTALSGLANAVLIGLVNSVAERVALAQPIGLRLAVLYLNAFALYYVAYRASLQKANGLLERRLGELRLRITDKIRRSELRTLETLGHGQLYATVAQEMNHLSQTFPLLIIAAQSFFVLVFCLLYIAYLSLVSFVLVTVVTAVGVTIFLIHRRAVAEQTKEVVKREAEMLESLNHFTEGFNEVRLNADKSDALYQSFQRIVDRLEAMVVGIGKSWVVVLMFTNAFMYTLLGAIAFILPLFFTGYTGIIYKLVAASTFLTGPLVTMSSVAPLYTKANIGLEHVFRLEQTLDAGLQDASFAAPSGRFNAFQKIECQGITFSYRDAAGNVTFSTGPWDLSLERGEIVFLLGGNGSGKSTALKLLTGLYPPDAGRILVDGEVVSHAYLQEYRELFSVIFPDFHLFNRLHGLEGVDPAVVKAQIEAMELTGKVELLDGQFTTLDLSTGQRKRLAMIAALLEDREIYVFDEWAADQDSHFREVFYKKILPELKGRGKSVMVVTHDAGYASDRIIDLDLGAFVTRPGGACIS